LKTNDHNSEFDRLFKEGLQNHKASVPDGLWQGIQSSLPASPSAPVFSNPIVLKSVVAVVASGVIAAVSYVAVQSNAKKDSLADSKFIKTEKNDPIREPSGTSVFRAVFRGEANRRGGNAMPEKGERFVTVAPANRPESIRPCAVPATGNTA
jgi:hypothetical protein